jgi:serine/threonine-protein kinase
MGKTHAVTTGDEESRPRLLVARYELGDRLGHGGMGEVWAATDRRLGRDVAVKQLRVDLAEQPVARRRFETEARAAAGLTHPNIVTVYDCGEDEGRPFLVMERLPGRTLADEIVLGPLALERAVEVSCAVLSALSAAHEANIIHRDIKPGNVLLTDTGMAKVSDFGIAKTAEGSTATVTGELLATPAYLAPERIRGEPASPASDLYAVGVLLYESLSGTRPFQGDTPIAVLDAVARGGATPLASIRSDLPVAVLAVVERAMATDPGARFSSAAEMAAALAAPSADDATVRIDPEHAGATQPFAGSPLHDDTRVLARPSASPRRRSRGARRWVAAGLGLLVVAAVGIGAAVTRDDSGPPKGAVPSTSPTVVGSQAPANGGSLPAPLDRSLRDLEEAVSQ